MKRIQQGILAVTLATLCSITTAQTATQQAKTTPPPPANGAVSATPIAPPDDPSPTDVSTPAADATATPATTVASAPINDPPPVEYKDPYEGFNRFVFNFNEKLDKYFMKPIATAYNAVMPRPLNQGVHNVFNNIGTLPTIANDLLQFNFYQAANDSWRVVINTTVGVGGLFDIASRIGLKYYTNDFGLTLANYGYENSNYLVLPFFGPSTPRDGLIGIPVDYYAFSLYPYITPESTRYQVYGVGVVDRRAQLLKFQEVMDEASVDKYVFVRNAFMQRRAHLIQENQHLGYDERESSEPVADTSTTTDVTTTTSAPTKAELEAGPAA